MLRSSHNVRFLWFYNLSLHPLPSTKWVTFTRPLIDHPAHATETAPAVAVTDLLLSKSAVLLSDFTPRNFIPPKYLSCGSSFLLIYFFLQRPLFTSLIALFPFIFLFLFPACSKLLGFICGYFLFHKLSLGSRPPQLSRVSTALTPIWGWGIKLGSRASWEGFSNYAWAFFIS